MKYTVSSRWSILWYMYSIAQSKLGYKINKLNVCLLWWPRTNYNICIFCREIFRSIFFRYSRFSRINLQRIGQLQLRMAIILIIFIAFSTRFIFQAVFFALLCSLLFKSIAWNVPSDAQKFLLTVRAFRNVWLNWILQNCFAWTIGFSE